MKNDDSSVDELLNQLKQGLILVKRKSSGKQYSRNFFLHEREELISYHGSRKVFGKARTYYVKDIDEIRTGFHGQTFHRLVKRGVLGAHDEARAFSILLDNHRQEVHLLAPNSRARDLWIKGLQHLTHRHSNQTQLHLISNEDWILNFFHAADRNHSNTLSKNECRELLSKKFNVKLPSAIFDAMFKKMDKSKDGHLNAEEFVNFFRLLTHRNDIYEIMKNYARHQNDQSIDKIAMNRSELIIFLRDDNKIPEGFINEFEMNRAFREKNLLSFNGFRNMLLSSYFEIIDYFASRTIYHDMTRPLCDYYINTSHNTYLFYSQLSGDSNPEAYNRVLLMGCRAVEFDCYDGDENGPIVKHAYTLVRPCLFQSIIRTIQPNLFKASPYPVILNIENHCSAAQQRIMARILKNILGDQLLTAPLRNKDPRVLPSPEDLKYKVLIRSKKTSSSTRSKGDDDDPPLNPVSKNIEPELEELFIYLQNVPYRENNYSKANYSPFQSSSLAEDHLLKHMKEDPVDLIQQTTWRLLRLYPGGIRQDSSNPDPVHGWNCGVQLVALNYQNDGTMMSLNYGKFLDNGGCGYILKPNYLRAAEQTKFNPFDYSTNWDHPLTLRITIISGQFLPRSSSKTSDIPDPYVRLSTHGVPCDEFEDHTRTVNNNGLDPTWNERFEFRIRYPQMCLLYVAVMDKDVVGDDRMAFFCAPVKIIQRGYRHIHLRANNNDVTYSTLFVHIDIEDSAEDDLDFISTRV